MKLNSYVFPTHLHGMQPDSHDADNSNSVHTADRRTRGGSYTAVVEHSVYRSDTGCVQLEDKGGTDLEGTEEP